MTDGRYDHPALREEIGSDAGVLVADRADVRKPLTIHLPISDSFTLPSCGIGGSHSLDMWTAYTLDGALDRSAELSRTPTVCEKCFGEYEKWGGTTLPDRLKEDNEPDTEPVADGGVGPIIFSDPTARHQLETEGVVVTFRTSERTVGETWWRETRTGEKCGDVTVELIGSIDPGGDGALQLQEYADRSGFESVAAWESAIIQLNDGVLPDSGYLYRATSVGGATSK